MNRCFFCRWIPPDFNIPCVSRFWRGWVVVMQLWGNFCNKVMNFFSRESLGVSPYLRLAGPSWLFGLETWEGIFRPWDPAFQLGCSVCAKCGWLVAKICISPFSPSYPLSRAHLLLLGPECLQNLSYSSCASLSLCRCRGWVCISWFNFHLMTYLGNTCVDFWKTALNPVRQR